MVIDHIPSGNQTSLIYHYFPRVSPFYLFLGGGCKKELLGCGDTEKVEIFTDSPVDIHILSNIKPAPMGSPKRGAGFLMLLHYEFPRTTWKKSNKTLGARGTPQRNLSLSITKHSHQSNLQPTNTSGPKRYIPIEHRMDWIMN